VLPKLDGLETAIGGLPDVKLPPTRIQYDTYFAFLQLEYNGSLCSTMASIEERTGEAG
jgi:hypothetical protein